ncbi:protein of unknown function [Methylococcus capsulatus]|uniref:Uncharacterized protein n=1 Tax=Methylococcus capsulatus TaxID=414 RepID=A0AA35UCI9_METCP|nr:protein of unknown function [Methylococcus capsulatus]
MLLSGFNSLAMVSIHSRLFSREILGKGGGYALNPEFQSTPGYLAGRYRLISRRRSNRPGFNPLPAI